MDEYLLADTLLSFEELSPEETKNADLYKYTKIPLSSFVGLGGSIAELIPQFRTITQTKIVDGTGLFKAFNPKNGQQMLDLQFKSKQIADAFVGSMQQSNGHFDQTAFIKAGSLKEVAKTVSSINPELIAIGIALSIMSQKLNKIEETQQNILTFLEDDKRTAQEGTLKFLSDVFTNYKYNWNNSLFKQTAHVKTQDIKEKAEGNILFYRKQIEYILEKKHLLSSRAEVIRNRNKLLSHFANYRLAVYLYAFASMLEVLLLENYNHEYLTGVTSKIREYSYAYAELYTECYVQLSETAKSSVETGIMKGISIAAKATGKVINKIPIIERGPVDEMLIDASDKLNKYKDDSIDSMLTDLTTLHDCSATQFSDVINSVDELNNGKSEIFIDNENLYVRMGAI